MLEKLAGHSFYFLLDGYFDYTQISIAPEDQKKSTCISPFGTYALRRMPFGVYSAQRFMISIFLDLVEKCIEIFMDNFSVFGSSFDDYLSNLNRVLQRCE